MTMELDNAVWFPIWLIAASTGARGLVRDMSYGEFKALVKERLNDDLLNVPASFIVPAYRPMQRPEAEKGA